MLLERSGNIINIANTEFKNDNSDNVALESILLERSGDIINIANTEFKNNNSDNVALESYGKANRSSEGR